MACLSCSPESGRKITYIDEDKTSCECGDGFYEISEPNCEKCHSTCKV